MIRRGLSLWHGRLTFLSPRFECEDEATELSMAQILRGVAEKHGLTVEDLLGAHRFKDHVYARQEAMAEIRAAGKWSFPQIGKFLGGRDHSTIIYGVRAHMARQRTARAAKREADKWAA